MTLGTMRDELGRLVNDGGWESSRTEVVAQEYDGRYEKGGEAQEYVGAQDYGRQHSQQPYQGQRGPPPGQGGDYYGEKAY